MPTSISLSPEIEQRLDFLVAQTGQTKEYYLQQLIERGLEDLEDYYLAADVLKRVRKGEEPVYESADVKQELGLEN